MYVVLFLVVAAGAYSLIGTAQQPQIDVEGESYAENDTVTVNGYEYTFASVGAEEATVERVNESAEYTETFQNNSTVDIDNTTYRVLIPNTSDPGEFTLREEIELGENVSTVEQNETTYVVIDEGENMTLVPVDEYLNQEYGEPETQTYSEGETFQYEGNETTVSNITVDEATLTWTAPRTLETSFAEGEEVALGPEGDTQTFVAHFPEEGTVVLSQNPAQYEQQVEEIDQFNERIAGLWGIVILSVITAILLIGLAFLPNK